MGCRAYRSGDVYSFCCNNNMRFIDYWPCDILGTLKFESIVSYAGLLKMWAVVCIYSTRRGLDSKFDSVTSLFLLSLSAHHFLLQSLHNSGPLLSLIL